MEPRSSPQLLAEGEKSHKINEQMHTNPNLSYASLLQPRQAAQLHHKQSAAAISKSDLCPVTIEHGELTINFTLDEVNEFTREEGLHQAVVMKFSYGKPDIQEIRRLFQSQFDVQGSYRIGQLEYRHLLVRFDVYSDYVQFLSKTVGYLTCKDEEYMFRTFPWTLYFNPKEETSMAVVWISLPELPPNFFAKKSVLSIASAVGKPLAVDKATHDRTRPSTARVKILIDLLKERPNNVKLRVVDKSTGKSLVFYQKIIYDNLPKYCCCCKHQGHDEKSCRFLEKTTEEKDINAVTNLRSNKENNGNQVRTAVVDNKDEQYQGDARMLLNAKRFSQVVGDLPSKEMNNGKQLGIRGANFPSSVQILQAEEQILGSINNGEQAVNGEAKDLGKVGKDMRTGNSKKAGVWNVVTSKKSLTNKPASSSHGSPNSRQKSPGNISSSNMFDIFAHEKLEQQQTQLPVEGMSNQLIPWDNTNQKGQGARHNFSEHKRLEEHSYNVPTIQFSSPQVEKIIKDTQAAIMRQTNMVKQPIVTLNTSDFEIPSQTEKSFDENEGDSGQLIPVRGTFGVHQGEDDEEECGDVEEKESTDYDESESEDDEKRSVASPQFPSKQKSNLNLNAPVFVPSRGNPSITISPRQAHQLTNSISVPYTTVTTSVSQQLNQTITNSARMTVRQNQCNTSPIVSVATSAYHQQHHRTGPNNGNQQQRHENALLQQQKQERKGKIPVATNAKDDSYQPMPQKCKEKVTKEKYDVVSPEQLQLFRTNSSNSSGDVNSPIIVKKVQHVEPNYIFDALYEQYTDAKLLAISQDDHQKDQPTNNLVCVKLAKMCTDEASTRGFKKNRHSKKISGDGKLDDEINVRQIPMKLAKQKKAIPTISTRSTRSQKKR